MPTSAPLARALRRALRSCRDSLIKFVLAHSQLLFGWRKARSGCPGVGACEHGDVIPAAGSSDGLVVRFGTEPNPPAKGDNAIQVTVTRSDGSPLTAAL